MEERTKLLTASLIVISKEKQRKLEAIKKLTLAQKAVTRQEDTDILLENLVNLIAQKQKLINEISVLDENYKKLRSQLDSLIHIGNWQNAREHSNSQVRELSNILQKNTLIMKEIQALDLENTNKMQENLQQLQGQLQRAKQNKKAVLGYENYYAGVDAYFVDKKR